MRLWPLGSCTRRPDQILPKDRDMTTTTEVSYSTAPNQVIHADNGIAYAYREIGSGTVPLVLLQHFRGNLENWDPPLVDALGAERRVIAFDNAGVGATTGNTPDTIEQMA